MKRILSILLASIMLCSLLSILGGAEAESKEAVTSVQNRLERVLQEYPRGTKWTSGGQCYGFAQFVVNEVFGKKDKQERAWWQWVNGNQDNRKLVGMKVVDKVLDKGFKKKDLYDLLKQAKPGDVIQCTGDGEATGHVLHSMIVYSVSLNKKQPEASEIVIYDNNWGKPKNNNIIRLWKPETFETYYGDVKNRGKLALLRADNYDERDQTPYLFIPTHLTIASENEKTLNPVISPAQAYSDYQNGLQWSSSEPSVATVDANGKIHALKAGSTKITVKTADQKYSGSCKVTVVDLGKPTTFGLSAEKEAIKITWSGLTKTVQVSEKDVYTKKESMLQRREVDGKWVDLKTGLTKSSYTDKTAEGGKLYEYRMRTKYEHTYTAKKGTRTETVWSAWCLSSRDGIPPVAPKTITLTCTEKGIIVNWSASKNATEYAVLRKQDNGSWEVLSYVTGESYQDKTVKPGKTYQYAIRARGEIGWGTAGFSSTVVYTATSGQGSGRHG